MNPSAIPNERLFNSLILIVDDVESNRAMLVRSLNSRGYHKIIIAKEGMEALRITQDMKPDLVILDLIMPGMDGFSYCQAIRRDPLFDNMPIVVQTMLEDMENKLKAFYLGASDFIAKPIDPDELAARTHVHLSKKLLIEDLHNFQKQIRAEIESARVMQERLLPSAQNIAMCERIFDMKIAVHFETSSSLGGDCWGMRPLSEKKLAIYSYDFSGHGISAALNVFRIHTLMNECIHAAADAGHFLEQLNMRLHPLLERNEFATMFYGVIDTDSNCIIYATAAAPAPILFNHREQQCEFLSGTGFPLGSVNNATYEKKYAPFLPEDLLVFCSDCVTETKNATGDVLTDKDIANCMISVMAENNPDPARRAVDAVLTKLKDHQQGPLEDDLTINAYWRGKK